MLGAAVVVIPEVVEDLLVVFVPTVVDKIGLAVGPSSHSLSLQGFFKPHSGDGTPTRQR